jgi:hypothetical protein
MTFMTPFERLSRCAAIWGACTAVACASAPKAEVQPGAPTGVQSAPALASEPEPQSLAEAEALLERAQAELERVASNETATRESAAEAAPSPAPRAAAPPTDDKSAADADGAGPSAKAENSCQSACRAYASLTRASEAVCRLDAPDGKRCERARRIVDDASRRVATCGCVQ